MNSIIKAITSLSNQYNHDLKSKEIKKTLLGFLILFSLFFRAQIIIAQPTITSFTPLRDTVGATVSITGTGFNTTPANNIVFFGATRATVITANATSLIVTVPAGATFAPITLLNIATRLITYSTQFFNPMFQPNKGSINPTDIISNGNYSTDTNPYCVAIGDLDGDGKPDIAVINSGSSTVSVLRNTSSSSLISFASKIDFNTGLTPRSITIGDINSDGKLDLAIANWGSNTVSILLNNSSIGNVGFATKLDYSVSSNPISIAINDLNEDGKLDLIIANNSSATVSILRNTSSLISVSFAAKLDFVAGLEPNSIAIGDIDGDGKKDLTTANVGDGNVSILRNIGSSGTINFASKIDYPTGSQPSSVAIGDLDRDGKLDLAITNQNNDKVSIYRNTSSSGTISFASKVDFATCNSPSFLNVSDMDGDGKSDLAIVNGASENISILRNISSVGIINFATKVDCSIGSSPTSVAISDLNSDGKPDLAITNFYSNTVSVFRNSPQPTPSAPSTIISINPTTGKVGDSITIKGTGFSNNSVNNIVFFGATQATIISAIDTIIKVLVPVGATYAPITVLNINSNKAAYSNMSFNPTFIPSKGNITSIDIEAKLDFTTGPRPYSVAIGDFDGDGRSDLVLANQLNNTVSVLRNIGNNNSVSFATKIDFGTGSGPQSLAVSDLNGDGKLDIAIGNNNGSGPGGNSVSILLNISSSGTINFASKVDFATNNYPNSIVVGDIDGDGRPDLATSNTGSTSGLRYTISVLRNTSNNGTISFATKVDYATGPIPRSIAIGDVNGDGKSDLTVISNDTVSILLNTSSIGTINFAQQVHFRVNSNHSSVSIGDIDGDGKLDLAITNPDSNNISVLRNLSNITTLNYAIKTDFTTGPNPISINIGDIDGDGKPDLAIDNKGNNTVSILRNTSSIGFVNFATKVDFVSGLGINALKIGDLTGDGKPDIAIANYYDYTVSILKNNPQIIPTITTIESLSSFVSCAGKTSVSQIFTISAIGLTTNLILTAPTGFEISTNPNSNYGGSITLPPVSSIINNTNIFIRLTSSATGSPNGNVICSSMGATTKNIAVSGLVNAVTITSSTNNISICHNSLPFIWNGRIYNTNAVDTIYLSNSLGCDSITILKLTIKPTSTSTNIISICPNLLPFIWNGRTYNSNRTDTIYLTNSVGCDSLTILKLTIKPTSASTSIINICPSALPYTWNGRTYNSNRTDTVILTNAVGCDSITILKLTTKPTSASTSIISICPSALPYTWNGRTYNSNRTDTIILTNAVGCDSITILKLTVKSNSTSTSIVNICPSALPYTWNSRTYNSNRTDTIILTNTVGCDSITILKLTIKPTSISTNIISICPSALPYTWNGRTYNSNRTDTIILTNAVDCDSITILKLTVKPTSSSTSNISICPSALPYTWNGLIFNASGAQTKTGLTNSVGCDSSATLNLTVKSTITSTNSISICPIALPYIWNGLIFNAAGTQTKTGLTNSLGCDSSATLNLTVNASPSTSNITGLTNVARLDTTSYSVTGTSGSIFNWVTAKGLVQTGAGTNQIQVKWNAIGMDTLKVIETSNQGCVGSQKTLLINIGPAIGINEINTSNILVYPNPFNETIFISLLNNSGLNKAILYDLLGKEILTTHKSEIDVKDLKSGVYLIMVIDNNGNSYSQKLVKN